MANRRRPVFLGLFLTFFFVFSLTGSGALLVSRDSSWRYHRGTTEASDPRSAWREVDFDDTGSDWSTGTAPIGYPVGDVTTYLSDMQGGYSTFYMRKTFTVSDLGEDSRIRLAVNYDDGFIIWINGERVLDKNEPDGTPLHNSLARETAGSNRVYEEYDVSDAEEFLELGTANVIAVQVFNASLGSSSDCLMDVELSTFRKVGDTKFSHDRGYYDDPFTCTITTDTPGATIRYTLNGSDPLTSGSTVSGVSPLPVLIDPASGTGRLINGQKAPCVVLRAYAFHGGGEYESSNVDTHTYVFVGEVPSQPNCMSGEDWIPGEQTDMSSNALPGRNPDKMNTAMDPDVVSAEGATTIENALMALPTLSVVGDYGDIFGNSYGIYHNNLHWGPNWERPVSLELINPDGSKGFQIDCGTRVSGQWSRTSGQSKMSLSMRFRAQYGESKLRHKLFPNTNVEQFDHIRLRAQGNDRWLWQPANAQYIRDELGRSLQRDMGWVAADGTNVHLYINGMYWGVYNPVEVPHDTFMAEHFGGEPEDYDVYANHKNYDLVDPDLSDPRVVDGTIGTWNTISNLVWNRNLTIAGDYANVCDYLDVVQHADYNLINQYAVNWDWDWGGGQVVGANFRCGVNRETLNPKMRFFIWDIEVGWQITTNATIWTWATHKGDVDVDTSSWPGINHWHGKLLANSDYKMLWADRIYKHMIRDGGLLTVPMITNRWMQMCNAMELPLRAESARWGDALYDTPRTVDGSWKPMRDWLISQWLVPRGGYALQDWKNAGQYPLVDPPEFVPDGGAIGAGFQLTMTNPNGIGTLVYRTDGQDPRASGGTERSGTSDYSAPVALSRTTHVRARVRKNNATWSAVHESTFNYTAHYPLIRLTEIHYNPLGGGDFEFLEIRNVSGSTTVGLSEMTFSKGLNYTFAPGAELGPGKYAVLVRNEAVFTNRYPSVKGSSDVSIFGAYTGGLDNGGERVELVDTDGVEVFSVRYNDKDPWPEEADGDGFSLVYTGGDDDQDHPEKWRASNLIGGSPGYDEGAPYRVLVNEALTHTDLPLVDAIELHNDGDTGADIGGWWLSDSDNDFFKYELPSYTLPAGGYKVYDENDFGAAFRLSSHGDEVYLTKWDANSNLLYYAEARFGGAENGVAFGRHVMSDGDTDFTAQSVTNTLGTANAYPQVGPIVITELMYHPPDGGDEFIELMNVSDAAVTLYDPAHPTNTWRLDGAVEYTFPTGVTMQAGEIILVIATNSRSAFKAKYSVPLPIEQIFKQYTGALNNGGESVKLWRPDTPDTNGLPWILVDRVKYNDNSPWPESADGDGPSLERIAGKMYGNDPMNWSASAQSNGTPGAANSGVLVSKTAGWRYHDRGADLGSAWRAAAYDDSSWEDGNAPLGYPDTNPLIDTEVDYGDEPADKQPTTYFRKAFAVADASKVDSLTLHINYDDGYVAYLNGDEVARGGMPGGAIAYTTLATSLNGSTGTYQQVNLNTHIGKLVGGPGQMNMLAVEVHQQSAGSSDLFLDLDLVHTVTVTPTVAVPAFNPVSGTGFSGSLNVTISTATSGATVFYTTDGSTPDTGDANNGTASVQVNLTDTTTIKARAYRDGMDPSAIGQATYTETLPTVATPTMSPDGGDFYTSVNVTISTATSGATVFYTTDGSTPDTGDANNGTASVQVNLTATTTLKARAYKLDHNESSVKTATFTDQTPTVRFVASSSAGSESVTPAQIGVELTGTSPQTIRVDYQTTGGGTASAGSDFTAVSGTLTFTSGQTSKTISVTITDDADEESDETIVLQLSNAQNADLGTSTHTYTITDNDQLFVSYNDFCWVTGEPTQNITTYTRGQGGLLLDYATGSNTPVTLTVTGGNGPWDFQGAPPDPGTDGYDVFYGIVGMTGVVSYSTTNLDLSFSGLDPGLRYEVVVFGNRASAAYADRTTIATLSGVEPGFQNQSSAGTTNSTTTLTDDTVEVGNGYNTPYGRIAKWTQIDPGSNGQMTITLSDNDTKFYANALMLRALSAGSSTEELIAKGATGWRWRRGTTEASDPATDWRRPGFDDSGAGWSTGTAPFGYGALSYNTPLDMQNDHVSVFFRKALAVDKPAQVNELTINVDYDDGFILWLNGEEIGRTNVQGEAGSFVAHDQACSGYVGGASANWTMTYQDGTMPALETNNVLAVQLFNAALVSGDALFDLSLSVLREQPTASEDPDADGLPNDWETAQYGSAGAYDWDDDPDLDGLNMLQERVAGTGATNPASSFNVDVSAAGGDVLVSFTARAVSGPGYNGQTRHYALQYRPNPGPNAVWQAIPGYADIQGQDQTVVYTNTSPAATEIYRGRVWLQ